MSGVIKFRAWDFKEMRYDVTGLDHGVENEMAGVFLDGEYHAISNLNGDVYNKTALLMQFTGLHDVNGTEIWQGDIIRLWNGNKTFVGHDGFQFTTTKKLKPVSRQMLNDCNVIGNMYQNPELLEKK